MSIRIECPECGYNVEKIITEIKGERKFTCPGCGSPSTVEFVTKSGSVSKSPAEILDNANRDIDTALDKFTDK